MKLVPSDTAREAAGVLATIVGAEQGGGLTDDFFAHPPARIWDELVSGGWTQLGVPEPAGGGGLDLIDLALVAETWGRYLLPLPYVPTVLLSRWAGRGDPGGEPGRLTYSLPTRHRRGRRAPEGLAPYGSQPMTRVVDDLAGMMPPAGRVGAAVVALSQAGRPRPGPGGGAGGPRASPSLPLARLSRVTAGLPPAAPGEIAVLGAAELVGCGRAVLDRSVAYARTRVQFGVPIAQYQAVQHRLADMQRDVELARTAVVWAANADDRRAGAVAQAWNRIRRVTEGSIQIHGGFGFTWEAGLHFYSRHVLAWGELLEACGVSTWPA